MSERKFGQDEEKMVYFFLLSSLRKEHFNEVGIEDKGSYYYLTSEDKMRIIENLTAKQKAVIRRDYLIANFKDAFGNNATASLLLDFAQSICPKNLPISKTDIMKCTKSDTNASRKRKPLCRNKPRRKRNNPMNRNPKRKHRPNRKRKK